MQLLPPTAAVSIYKKRIGLIRLICFDRLDGCWGIHSEVQSGHLPLGGSLKLIELTETAPNEADSCILSLSRQSLALLKLTDETAFSS